MIYIEDYLQHYVEQIGVTDSNKQILESINRHCNKGTALTDRQYELVKSKLLEVAELELFTGDEPTRLPLREIDRSKYIKIVNDFVDVRVSNTKSTSKCIEIRFPFSKKTIISLQDIADTHKSNYYHKKGSHQHFFKLTPLVILDIVEEFCKKDFEIDDELIDMYKEVKFIKSNPKQYVPGFWFNEFLNFKKDINQLTKELLPFQLLDRKRQLGIEYITSEVPSGLTGEICNRELASTIVSTEVYSVNDIILSIDKLNRFPLLVLLDTGEELEQISQVYNSIKHLVSDKMQSVLTRVDSQLGYNFNDFVKNNQLNNWLDNDTKVVYISKNKLPKLLLKESWKPQCVLSLTSLRETRLISTYVNDVCDLIIAHDTHQSLWRNKRGIM